MINYIYMGISDNSIIYPGWFNQEHQRIYFESNCDYEKSVEESKKLISERLSYFAKNPKEFFEYFSKKIGSTWLNPTFQTIWYSSPGIRYKYDGDYASYITFHPVIIDMVAGGKLNKIEDFYFKIYEIIILIFASIGLFTIAIKNLFNLKNSLLPIIFFGGFLFHIIWETKSIYAIQYYYLLIPFASYGLNFIYEIIAKRLACTKLLEKPHEEKNKYKF